MTKESKFCPECGSPNIYVGINRIECGYDEECVNYTKTQAQEVTKNLVTDTKSVDLLDEDEEEDTNPYGFLLPSI